MSTLRARWPLLVLALAAFLGVARASYNPSSGGSTLSPKDPAVLPTSPNAFDDEFDASAISGSWTQLNFPGAATATQGATGCLKFLSTTTVDTNSICGFVKSPGSTFTLICKVTVPYQYGQYFAAGMMIRDSVSGKFYLCGLMSFGGWRTVLSRWSALNGSSGYVSKAETGTHPWQAVYIKAVQDSTNITFSWSPDGLAYEDISTEGKTSFLTNAADGGGVGMCTFGAAGYAHFDWIRKQ
jgi:hypothetical protein